jgi:hypothetical protein
VHRFDRVDLHCTTASPHIPSAARLEQNAFVAMPVKAFHERMATIDGAINRV